MRILHNYSKNLIYFLFTHFLSYLLLYTFIILILYNIVTYDPYVYCYTIENSTDQFFMDNVSEPKPRTSDNTDRTFLDSGSNFNNTYYYSNNLDKYKNIGKRKISWFFIEKGKGNYANYKEYKKSWNSNTDVLSQIKKELKSDINNSLHKLKVNKRSLSWFFKGSKPGGGRGL